jgi:hypothetical protein
MRSTIGTIIRAFNCPSRTLTGDGFGELTAFDFLRVNTDTPGLRVLNLDPPVLTVDDFLTAQVGVQVNLWGGVGGWRRHHDRLPLYV